MPVATGGRRRWLGVAWTLRTTSLIVVLAHAFIFLVLFKIPFRVTGMTYYELGSDTQHVYWPAVQKLLAGHIPYVDPRFFVEYPPLGTAFFLAPALLHPPTLRVYDWLFALEVLAVDVATLPLIVGLTRRERVSATGAVAAYGLVVPLLGAIVSQRYDLVPATLTLGAVLALLDRRSVLAWLLLLLATLMKLYPAVLAPLFLLYEWHGWRPSALAAPGRRQAWGALLRRARGPALYGLGLVGSIVAWQLLAPASLGRFVAWETRRGVEIESVWGTVAELAHVVGALPAHRVDSYGSYDVASAWSPALKLLSTVATLGLLGAIYLSYARRRGGSYARRRGERPTPSPVDGDAMDARLLVTYVTLAVLGVLLGSKLLSIQFLLWLLPLLAAQPHHPRRVAILTLAVVLLSQWIYPMHWNDLWNFKPGLVLQLALRNGLLVALFVVLWRARSPVGLWGAGMRGGSAMIPTLPTRGRRRPHASPGVVPAVVPLHAVAARRVTPAWSWGKELARDVLPVVLLTRLLFVALTLLTPLWRLLTGAPPLALFPATGTWLDAWNRWDARWYMDLARLGYNIRGPEGFKNVAFFPLYPLLTRTLHQAIGHVVDYALAAPSPGAPGASSPPYLVAGMLVSNACAVAALAFFYGLVRLDHGRPAARRAATLLALCPASVFLFAAYSESTFLLCAIAFFYTLRLERWWQAGLWGLLAAATRPPGVVLLIPFTLAWAEAHPIVVRSLLARLGQARRLALARLRHRVPAPSPRPLPIAGHAAHPAHAVRIDLYRRRAGRPMARRAGDVAADESGDGAVSDVVGVVIPRDGRRHRRAPGHSLPLEVRQAVRNGAPVAAIPLGLALFMAFLGRVFGDPLWFSHAQQAWLRTFAPPWETLYISVAWPFGDLLHGRLTAVDFFALHDLLYEVAGLALTVLAWRCLPRTQGVYLWLVWLALLSSPAMLTERRTLEPHHDVLMSLPRLLLMLFPLFTYLGLQRRLYRPLVGAFAVGLVVYAEIFLTGGWLS